RVHVVLLSRPGCRKASGRAVSPDRVKRFRAVTVRPGRVTSRCRRPVGHVARPDSGTSVPSAKIGDVIPQAVVEALECPVCGAALSLAGGAVRCVTGHSFDLARQGYVNLLAGTRSAKAGSADTAEMVADRAAFLAAGPYEPLAAGAR